MAARDAIRIRLATGQDWESVCAIYNEVRRKQFPWIHPDSIGPDDLARDSEGEEIHIAVKGDKVLGFLSVWIPESFIHHLYVATEFQGQECGSKLLYFAAKTYPNPLRLKCVKQNQMALKFYLKNRWRVIEEGISEGKGYFLMELNEPNQSLENICQP
jgi:ribosomal protein S18 acetylase RimI-like enzyme